MQVFSTFMILVALGGSTPTAAFHNHLVKSVPAADQSLAQSPREIRLWFAERPEVALSRISVASAGGQAIPVSKVRATDDPLSVAVDVPESLPAGRYTITWRTAGKDGHAVKGSYAFSIGK